MPGPRAPLTVRLVSNGMNVDRHVTDYVSDLRFRKTAPGGHADASCHLDLPPGMFGNLGPTDRLYVYDARNASCLFDGYTNNPGTRAGRTGQGYDLVAFGGQSRLTDKADRFVYLDKNLSNWSQDYYAAQTPGATAQVSVVPEGSSAYEGEPCLFLQFAAGQPVDTAQQVGLVYNGMAGSSMVIGGLALVWDMGRSDTGWQCRWHTRPTDTEQVIQYFDSVQGGFVAFADGGNLDAGYQQVVFRAFRTGLSTNVLQNDVWAMSAKVSVIGHLLDRYGASRTPSTTAHFSGAATWILAHEIAEDLVGRALTFCDPATAVIDATTFAIDQLAYSAGVKPAQVLNDLLELEPDFLYEILESNAAGLHRFNWRAWPTTPRYLIPPSIPVEQPGGEVDLCNRIVVTWPDTTGKPQVTVRGAYVPALGNKSPILPDGSIDPTFVGRIRDADPITLPEGRGSLTNAQRIGDQTLAALSTPPRAARVVIDQPIFDMLTGGLAQPWEIEPGYLARVVATGDDLRITEMEYEDDSCSATLQLGEPVLTTEQRIARLAAVS